MPPEKLEVSLLTQLETHLHKSDQRRAISITELTRRIKDAIDESPWLGRLWVSGEISNYKRHTSGHIYFSLKDEGSLIRAVMFRSRADRLRFEPREGQAVLAFGNVGIYEASGQYQLYIEELEPAGKGALYQAFEQLKAKLQAEGLFDQSLKRCLPRLPAKAGVVTSATGAVIRDIISVSRRRYPNCHLVLAPVAVQGEEAPGQVARGISALNRVPGVEVIIVARGGGSLEELWAFNTEAVARAIRASEVPVVSAVGHETDYTIADFVADWRAPTPSAAAERVWPERRELEANLKACGLRLKQGLLGCLRLERSRLVGLAGSRVLTRPSEKIQQSRQRLDESLRRMEAGVDQQMAGRRAEFNLLVGRLEGLSPLQVLARGYSLCTRPSDGVLIRSDGQVSAGDRISVRLARGGFDCLVDEVWPEGREMERGARHAQGQSKSSAQGD